MMRTGFGPTFEIGFESGEFYFQTWQASVLGRGYGLGRLFYEEVDGSGRGYGLTAGSGFWLYGYSRCADANWRAL